MKNSTISFKRLSWQWPKSKSSGGLQKNKVNGYQHDSGDCSEELSKTCTATSTSSLDDSSVSSMPSLSSSIGIGHKQTLRPQGCLKRAGSNTDTGKQRRSVSFSRVQVWEFPVTAGDSPAVSTGPPITIGWIPISEASFTVTDYQVRTSQTKTHTNAQTFTSMQRFCLLKMAGFTGDVIVKASKVALQSKRERALTISNLHMDPFEEAIEKLARGTKNAIFHQKKREQRRVLQICLESDRVHLREQAW